MMYALIWVILAVAVAFYGKDRHAGFTFSLVMSLIFSPLIGLILVAYAGPKRTEGATCPNCGWQGAKAEVVAGFCPACGKDAKGLTRSDYQSKAGVTLSSGSASR